MTDETKRGRGGRPLRDAEEDVDIDAMLMRAQEELGGGESLYGQIRRFEVGDWIILASKVDLSDCTAENIQRTYGGGKFRVHIFQEGAREDGRPQQRRQITFKLAGKPKFPDDDDEEKPDAITERLDRLERMITESQGSGSTGLAKIAEVALAAALRPAPQPQRDPLLEALIGKLINGAPNSSGLDPLKLQELLMAAEERGEKRGREVGELSAGVASEGGIAGVLASNLPSIADSFSRAVAASRGAPAPAPRSNPPAAPAPAAATISPTSEASPVPTNPNAPVWLPYLRPLVPLLLKYAQSGKDPQIKAANMLDDLSPENRNAIATFAESESFVSDVLEHIPEFRATIELREWFTIFFATIQESMTDPVEDGDGAGEG